jgi:hypothetical protein
MWNPFRRKPAEEPVPKPEGAPIQQLDSIDITAKKRDGGVDLVIVASRPLDDSPDTLGRIRQKVGTYLVAIGVEEFQKEMGHPPRDKTTIIIICEHAIHPKALAVIAQCKVTAAAQGIRLEVRNSVAGPPIPLPEGANELAQSIQRAAQDDRDQIAAHAATVLEMLRARYGDVQLHRTEDDLRLLQRLHDDGGLQAGQERELEAVGIVFGEVLAARTPLKWITVEWQGERSLGLKYPNSNIIVFPGSMIAKRVNRGERVEFESLFRSTVDHVEQMKDDPGYKN